MESKVVTRLGSMKFFRNDFHDSVFRLSVVVRPAVNHAANEDYLSESKTFRSEDETRLEHNDAKPDCAFARMSKALVVCLKARRLDFNRERRRLAPS